MSVTPVVPISLISFSGQGTPRQQSGMQQNLNTLQDALASGNLALAQKAMTQLSQNAEQDKPSANGVVAAAADNPEATLRVDREALQSALDIGDVGAAQQSLIKLVQDTQQIADAQRAVMAQAGNQPVSALPKQSGNDQQDEGGLGANAEVETAKLVDVMA